MDCYFTAVALSCAFIIWLMEMFVKIELQYKNSKLNYIEGILVFF